MNQFDEAQRESLLRKLEAVERQGAQVLAAIDARRRELETLNDRRFLGRLRRRVECWFTAHSYQPPFAGTWDDAACHWCGKRNPASHILGTRWADLAEQEAKRARIAAATLEDSVGPVLGTR